MQQCHTKPDHFNCIAHWIGDLRIGTGVMGILPHISYFCLIYVCMYIIIVKYYCRQAVIITYVHTYKLISVLQLCYKNHA